MKVCLLRHGGYPNCARVAKEVQALLDIGAHVDVVCLSEGAQARFEQHDRLKVYRIPLQRRRGGMVRYFLEYFLSFAMMASLLSVLFIKRRYSCVQVNTMPDFLVFATLVAKLLGVPVVLDLHEPTPELWVTKYGKSCRRLLLKLQILIEQQAIRYADRVLTVTEPLRLRYAERGADFRKITVIPNACDEARFSNAAAEGSTHADPEAFLAVTHGTIEERYGHELMIRAVHRLKDRLPRLRLIIAGGGAFKPYLLNLVDRLDCADRVSFVGYLPFEKLLDLLRSADVGINAMYRSPYAELIDTNKMYEYITLRLPVITSRLPPIEAHFDDESLLYFEAGDADDLARCLERLHGQPQLRSRLVQNALRSYAPLSWNITRNLYTAQLQALAAPQPRRLIQPDMGIRVKTSNDLR